MTDDAIKEKVLEIVAEKTGYPKDMLDLDLDLEADLGIDTVKQAEMFAAVRAAYNIPRDENLKLRDFPTLAHVIKFARDRQPGLAKASAASSSAVQEKQEPRRKNRGTCILGFETDYRCSSDPASFDAANRIPRRVPVPNLRPPLALCKPTGVTLGPGRRVVVMPDKSGVADALAQRLQTMGVEVLRIEDDAGCGRTGESPQELAGRGSDTRSVLAARAGQRGRPQRIWTSPPGMKLCECA